jgi:MEMO1 family protein
MTFGPVVAGQFYNAHPRQLQEEIDGYLKEAEVKTFESPVFGIISPHAGYIYSGPCAAYAFKSLRNSSYDVAVVIGLSHRAPGEIGVLNSDSYRTPLGLVRIDQERTRRLLENEAIVGDDRNLFAYEHSIEVQLPFLQRSLPKTSVVLISIRSHSPEKCRALADALNRTFGDCKALYIASTDLSHFLDYRSAQKTDLHTLDVVRKGDIETLEDFCASGSNNMCGIAPVLTLMHLHRMQGNSRIEVLKYLNSGDTAGDRDRVVGYGAVAFLEDRSEVSTGGVNVR